MGNQISYKKNKSGHVNLIKDNKRALENQTYIKKEKNKKKNP